jgi:hypothetical protein
MRIDGPQFEEAILILVSLFCFCMAFVIPLFWVAIVHILLH